LKYFHRQSSVPSRKYVHKAPRSLRIEPTTPESCDAVCCVQPGDFWNLVGRAGRLNHEFSGNVFCIYGKSWESNPLVGDRMMPIESAFQIALTERAAELAIWATKPPLSADSSEAWAEQAFASIYADYVSTQLRLSDFD